MWHYRLMVCLGFETNQIPTQLALLQRRSSLCLAFRDRTQYCCLATRVRQVFRVLLSLKWQAVPAAKATNSSGMSCALYASSVLKVLELPSDPSSPASPSALSSSGASSAVSACALSALPVQCTTNSAACCSSRQIQYQARTGSFFAFERY